MLAVAGPAVLLAGLQEAILLVGAECDPAILSATAMFKTEAFAIRGGGAARHGARLLPLLAAVFDAMLASLCCRGGASINLAPPIRTMPSATPTCMSKSRAALNVAHSGTAATMSETQSSLVSSSCASVKQADLFGNVLAAEAAFLCT